MAIEKTTPYACEQWHIDKNDHTTIKKVTYYKNALTYCVDSKYNIRCSEISFNKAYSIAIQNQAFFEYDKISNKDLKYMSNVLYDETTSMMAFHNNKYCNESARDIYQDITKCMKIHNFIKPTINFATLTTIENVINKANKHIAENGFYAVNIARWIREELIKEYWQLNDEMQEKIQYILHTDEQTYRDIDDIIKQISKLNKKI